MPRLKNISACRTQLHLRPLVTSELPSRINEANKMDESNPRSSSTRRLIRNGAPRRLATRSSRLQLHPSASPPCACRKASPFVIPEVPCRTRYVACISRAVDFLPLSTASRSPPWRPALCNRAETVHLPPVLVAVLERRVAGRKSQQIHPVEQARPRGDLRQVIRHHPAADATVAASPGGSRNVSRCAPAALLRQLRSKFARVKAASGWSTPGTAARCRPPLEDAPQLRRHRGQRLRRRTPEPGPAIGVSARPSSASAGPA